jgi:hypothetical protein
MRLTILDRVLLLQILPKEGNIGTMRIVHNLRMELAPSEEEVKKCNIREDPEKDQLLWDNNDYTAEISIGEKANDVIVNALKRLNSELRLTEQLIPFFEIFVEGKLTDSPVEDKPVIPFPRL